MMTATPAGLRTSPCAAGSGASAAANSTVAASTGTRPQAATPRWLVVTFPSKSERAHGGMLPGECFLLQGAVGRWNGGASGMVGHGDRVIRSAR